MQCTHQFTFLPSYLCDGKNITSQVFTQLFTKGLKKILHHHFEFLGYCVFFCCIRCFYGVLKVEFARRGSRERPKCKAFLLNLIVNVADVVLTSHFVAVVSWRGSATNDVSVQCYQTSLSYITKDRALQVGRFVEKPYEQRTLTW